MAVDSVLGGGVIGGVIATGFYTLFLVFRNWANTHNKIADRRANTEATVQLKLIEGINSMAHGIKEMAEATAKGSDEARLERTQSLQAILSLAAKVEGITTVLTHNTGTTQALKLIVDDVERELITQKTAFIEAKNAADKLPTEIGESVGKSIGEQFAPVVDALKGVGAQLDGLSAAIQNKNEEVIERLGRLQSSIGDLGTTLLKAIEPIMIKNFNDANLEKPIGETSNVP